MKNIKNVQTNDEKVNQVLEAVSRLYPQLSENPEIQGGALANLSALWLANYEPDRREGICKHYAQLVLDLSKYLEPMLQDVDSIYTSDAPSVN